MKCAFNKERECDDSCAAFDKDKKYLYSELHFDQSNVVPQFDWKKTLMVKGNWCNRMDNSIDKFKIIKAIKDGKVVDI